MRKDFKQAISDAEFGIRLNPKYAAPSRSRSRRVPPHRTTLTRPIAFPFHPRVRPCACRRWAKLYSRKAVAHFYLKEFDESVTAYEHAVRLDPGQSDYAAGLARARAECQSIDHVKRKEAERRRLARFAAPPGGSQRGPGGGATQAERARQAEAQQREARACVQARYERDLASYRQTRREAVAAWRLSTGLEGEKPEEDRGRSIRVDIFGNLRGRCEASGCSAWERDVDAVANAWGNMEAIHCSGCGYPNSEHENCGQYPMAEPQAPRWGPGAGGAMEDIPGIHRAK